MVIVNSLSSLDIWHSRLSHASYNIVKKVLQLCKIPYRNRTKNFFDTCIKAKIHQMPFTKSNTIYSAPIELVFIDIWGPTLINASNGCMFLFWRHIFITLGFTFYILNLRFQLFLSNLII